MNAEELAEWLAHRLPQIPGLNLNPSQLSVGHVMNWGGFLNHSFYVSDGSVQYHLKLTDDPDSIGKLRKWHGIHHLLEERYRSPEIVLWMDFADIGFHGLLQKHVSGQTADFCRNPVLVARLIELLGHLHRDAEVRFHLNVSGSEKICYDLVEMDRSRLFQPRCLSGWRMKLTDCGKWRMRKRRFTLLLVRPFMAT